MEDVSRMRPSVLRIAGADNGLRIELALGWFAGYDSYELAALTVLSHGPTVGIPPPSRS